LTLVPHDPFLGTTLAQKYQIDSVIGKGGMSVVYKARNVQVGSTVAVKMLKYDLISDNDLFKRFSQEAQAIQRLTHPNIIAVHEFGVAHNGQPYLVMDYLKGELLSDIIEKNGRISVKRFLPIFIQVADALGHAHNHSVIHRDIKPDNIMLIETVTDTDVVKLFDFGFAKLLTQRGIAAQQLTQHGDVLGTPLYMSPEQSRGGHLDSRTDVYSLGCVMYEALTGRAPLVGDNVLDTMQKQINEQPVSLDTARPDLYIPTQLTNVLFKTLEKEREKRYQSMAELKRDLDIVFRGMTGNVRLPSTTKGISTVKGISTISKMKVQTRKERKRERLVTTIGMVAMLAAIAYLCYLATHGGFNWIPTGSQSEEEPSEKRENNTSVSADPRVKWSKYRQEAITAIKQGNLEEAEDILEVALQEAGNTEDSVSRQGTTLNELANVLRSQEKLSDAHKTASKALALRQKSGNQRAIAESLITLAEIEIDRDKFKVADGLLQRALAIQHNELGPTHQEVGRTLDLLGSASASQKNYPRAQAYFAQALTIRESALGPNSPAVAQTLHHYADLLDSMKRTKEAAKLEARARAIDSKAK
jgi:serine/threonine protein kinase